MSTKFRAYHQGFYWWIAPYGEIQKTSEYGTLEDNWAYRTGNYYENEEDAEKALEIILKNT